MAAVIATAFHNLWYQKKIISSNPELKDAGVALSSDIWPCAAQERCSGKGETFRSQLAALVAAPGWAVTLLRAGCCEDELPGLFRGISFGLVWN